MCEDASVSALDFLGFVGGMVRSWLRGRAGGGEFGDENRTELLVNRQAGGAVRGGSRGFVFVFNKWRR